MIQVEHLTKRYGTLVAVSDVSFSVGQGEVVGFLGPNGAGKSTTLRILAGFLGATSGSVRIGGHDIHEEPHAARRLMGYMPEAAPIYPEMRVREYLTFRAALKGVRRGRRAAAVARAMALGNVSDVSDVLVMHLSKGYRQRVALADALVAEPPLLILDEPTAGLDPNQIRDVRELIRELGKSHTILLSTHILSEVEGTCDRALVIHRGRLAAQGTIDELRRGQRSHSAVVRVRGNAEHAEDVLKAFSGITSIETLARADATDSSHSTFRLTFTTAAAVALESIITRLVQGGIHVAEATPERARLEDIFLALTEPANRTDVGAAPHAATTSASKRTADGPDPEQTASDRSRRTQRAKRRRKPLKKTGSHNGGGRA